jgi:hypothetical protein
MMSATCLLFSKDKDKMLTRNKGMATFASALICAYLLHISHGAHGIGWFIAAVIFIWVLS